MQTLHNRRLVCFSLPAVFFFLVFASVSHAAFVYHDFGVFEDFDTTSPMHFIKGAPDYSAVWRWNSSHLAGFHENGTDFHWVKEPADPSSYTNSRGIIFRKFARLRIDASGLPSSGPLYLTVRYKDNNRHGTHPGVPLWSNGNFLGTLGGTNDHRWKTATLQVQAENLEVIDGHFRIQFASNYTDQNAGELNIDKVKLSTDTDTSEFEADAPGLWPTIAPSNLRFANIGQTNEYIPGEGPFFPFGMYLTVGTISDGGSPTSAGHGPKDTWQILENAHMNTVIIHGWSHNWYSRWAEYPNHAPWAAPAMYVEMGLDEKLIQAAGHGIKVMPNFLTDTRAYWIDEYPNGSPDALAEMANVVRTHADHPAMLGWNPIDEWDHEDTSYTKPHLFSHQTYQICKENDPNRPVYMSLMGFGRDLSWEVAAAEADIFANDRYFDDGNDLEAGARSSANYLDDARQVLGTSKAILSIPKFGTSADKQKDYNGVARLPNETEVLFQAYLGITHGAQGLIYFRLIHPDDPSPYVGLDSAWAGFYRLGEELFGAEGIAHALIAPSKTIDIMGEMGVVQSSNPNVDFILKETADGTQLLITVNMVQTSQQTTFTVQGLGGASIPVHFENRSINPSSGSFTDLYGRFERHVYILNGTIAAPVKPLPPQNIAVDVL